VCVYNVAVTETMYSILHVSNVTLSFRYTLRNGNGVTVQILDYGAIISAILVPDNQGKLDDVTAGFDSLAGEFCVVMTSL